MNKHAVNQNVMTVQSPQPTLPPSAHTCVSHRTLNLSFHQGAGNAFLNGNVNNKKSTIIARCELGIINLPLSSLRLVNNPSYGFLAPPTRPSFSCSLSPSQKGNWWTPRVTSDSHRSASTEFPDVRVQSHCTESQVSCISMWARPLLRSIHPPRSPTYLLFSLQARYQCCCPAERRICRTNKRWLFADVHRRTD